MDSLQKLIEVFRHFPGIGPRQARRFAYFLLGKDEIHNKNLAALIAEIKREIKQCAECRRFVPMDKKNDSLCSICRDDGRDKTTLVIVSRDIDLDSLEKSGTYEGTYFVLGGSLPILEEAPAKKIRSDELLKLVEKRLHSGLKEIILALNANPEGEHTAEYLISILAPKVNGKSVKISRLGRGLSTGTELEYADSDTLKDALKNRF